MGLSFPAVEVLVELKPDPDTIVSNQTESYVPRFFRQVPSAYFSFLGKTRAPAENQECVFLDGVMRVLRITLRGT